MTPKHAIEWHHSGYTSSCGIVYPDALGEWVSKVTMPSGKYARLNETFVSAEAAKGAVERTWERENKR